MSSVLDKIYKNSEEVKDRVESIDNTLQRLFKAEVKDNKAEDKERKSKELKRRRALRKEKRDTADNKKGFFGAMTKDEKKKESNVIMDILKGALSGLGGMISNIFGMITSGLAGLGIGALFTAALPIIGGAIMAALAAVLSAAAVGVTAREGKQGLASYDKGQGRTKRGTSFMSLDVERIKELINESNTNEETKTDRLAAADAVIAQMMQTKNSNDQLYLMIEARKNRPKWLWEASGMSDAHLAQQRELVVKNKKELTRLMNILMLNEDISDDELLQIQLNQHRRTLDSLPEGVDKSKFTQPDIMDRLKAGAVTNFDYDDAQRKQTGGFTVPGNSTGDNHPYMLPPGSFVLNRNAAQHFQTGGSPNLAPVLLESKERVLLPGDPMMPMAMMMNDLIPRFQSGGFTGSPKSSMVDTGHTDAQGRKVLLSPAAAAAWEQMVKDGMPVNSGDIANVFRDEAEYNRLVSMGVSPASNSHHNHGEAADIHGAMNTWIRQNGARYGWVANDYSGSHGGHFEFKGPGSGGRSSGSTSGQNEAKNENALFSGLGNAGIFASTVFGGLGDYFGQKIFGEGFSIQSLFGGISGGIGNLLGMGNNNATSITGTGPVDMGADVNEKLKTVAKLAMDAGFTKEQAKIMAAIAGGESTFNNRAHNTNRSTGDNSYGLWQINMIDQLGPERRRMLGISSNDELFDPATNARAAKMIFDSQGFGAWGAYKDGNAAKYMNAAQALQLQSGGLTNVRGNRSSLNKSTEMIRAFGEAIAESSSGPPIIIYDDEPTDNVSVATDAAIHQTPPDISTSPSASPAKHYMFYDLNYGPVV